MKKTIKILTIILISLILGIKDIKAEELPKVYFEGNIEKMVSKSDERKIKLKYVSKELNFESYTKIKVQGTSSLAYDKKNYTIKLYEDTKYKEKMKVDMGYGWDEQYKYCLKANWIDKTHSRNIVTARIASNIQEKYNLFMDTPNNGVIDGFPVEIYINDDFLGIYTWNIPKDAWMFNMDEDNENHIVLAAEGADDSNLFKEHANFKAWSVEVGTETNETLDKFNKLIDFIKDSSDKEFKENFVSHLNLDSTINYYIMVNLANLGDNISKNMLMVTYDGEIWYPSLYDLDTSWGTHWKGTSTTDYKEDMDDNSLLFTKLSKNFSNEIADRYFELRKDILTKENILNEFYKFYETIPEETLKKEQNRWKDIPGYDITQIEEFLNIRIPLVDKKMYNIYNINPQVNIEYSTKKATLKPITVELIPNRTDITILKDGKKIDNNTYTFTKNGEYEFEYQDWYGNNLGTITVKITNIKTQNLINLIISIIIITISIILFVSFKKKKTNKKETKANDNKTIKKEEIKKVNTKTTKDKPKEKTNIKKEIPKKNSNTKSTKNTKKDNINKSSNSKKKPSKNSNTKKSSKTSNNTKKNNKSTSKKDINSKHKN